MRPVGLRVEHHEGLGVGTARPRLSWRTEDAAPNWHQVAWEVDARSPGGEVLWHSGRVEGRESVLVAWGGAALASRAACRWRVRVWGDDGSESGWSEDASFEIGLLSPDDWSAQMIAPAWDEPDTANQPCPHLRTTFEVAAPVRRARLHVTALGVYEASLNGERVGDHALAPGWTAYASRLHVQTFDVTDLLRDGENAIEIVVGDGWYRGNLGFAGNRNIYGDRTAALAQLEIDHEGGTTTTVVTDDAWQAGTGPTLSSDLYDGEVVDARIERGPWTAVQTVPFDRSVLVSQPSPPVRVTEIVRPVAITTSPSGKTIVDFGQNLVGVVRIRPRGPAGTTITLRHAEVLEHGELCTRILREAKATDTYVTRGDAGEQWHPRFTFHGFQFAEVSGWPGDLTPDDIDALVWHTDMRRTGWFECSDDLVNQLHSNIVWGWRGNTVSLPTDCPQRDERLGWTGDLQAFAPTACFIYDATGFLSAWLEDLAADQLADGRVPAVIPNILTTMNAYAAGWGDAATVVPTVLHQWSGDVGVLERQFDSMARWVDSIAKRAGPTLLWNNEFQFGDWVDPTVDPLTPGAARTDSGFVATAYFARSADFVARAAVALGRTDDAARYSELAAEIRDALRDEWVAPSGRVVADTQAGCALALAFDLVEEKHRGVVGDRLRQLVRLERHRISTGFLGTPVLNPALTAAGHVDTAYRLLFQTKAPSWLYPVTKGATTIWERWDALRPDGSLNPGSGMLSFNHYALGAVGAWLHETVGGLSAIEPGFGRFRVAPEPGPTITWAETRFDSPHGRIEIRWELAGCGLDLRVTVPPNTDADVVLPGRDGETTTVGHGTHQWRYGVDASTFRTWTGLRPFGPNTSLGQLRSDADAWAVVHRHAPEFAERFGHDEANDDRTFVTAASMASVDEQARVAIIQQLSKLGPAVPDAPEPIGV